MSWTEERIERMKAQWADGVTATDIARELGAVSRNAVIGKLGRLGLLGTGRRDAPRKVIGGGHGA